MMPALVNRGTLGRYLDNMIVIQCILTFASNDVIKVDVPDLLANLTSSSVNGIVSDSIFAATTILQLLGMVSLRY